MGPPTAAPFAHRPATRARTKGLRWNGLRKA